jgi:hypothetical protein
MFSFRKISLGFALLLGLTNPASAKPGDIFIDPLDATLIRREIPGGQAEIIFRAQDLPTESSLHPVHFGPQKFTFLAVNPEGTILAFSAQAGDHEWSGLYYLANKDIRQLNLRFESKSLAPYWSKDSRYLVVEEEESTGRRFLEIFDLEKDDHCVLDGRAAKNKFLNFLQPWWSEQGERIFFKAEINNRYRKSLGLKSLNLSETIGEANPRCQKLALKPLSKFLAEQPRETIPQETKVTLSPSGEN